MPRSLLKVLVVDDTVEQVESLELLLGAQGFSTYTAIGAEAGIAKCKVHPPDVVILDWVMPPPGGFGFMEWFRGQERFQKTPVLIMTGLDMSDVPEAVLDATLVLFKPYSAETLIRFLDGCLPGKVKP